MKSALPYYLLIALFALLFILGFFTTTWLCLVSFVPLIIGAVVLIRYRCVKK